MPELDRVFNTTAPVSIVERLAAMAGCGAAPASAADIPARHLHVHATIAGREEGNTDGNDSAQPASSGPHASGAHSEYDSASWLKGSTTSCSLAPDASTAALRGAGAGVPEGV